MQEIYKWKDVSLDYFSIDDYMNMNKGVEMIRFNPSQVTRIRKAEGIDFYKDFSYYEMSDSSLIRSFPVTFFYSKKTGYFFELDKTKSPIYALAAKANPKIDLKPTTDSEDDIFFMLKKYILFFFDNVAGRHGYFHLVENFDDIKKYVKLYFNTNEKSMLYSKEKIKVLEKSGKLNNLDSLIQKVFVIPSNSGKFKINKAIKNNRNWIEFKNDDEIIFSLNCFMIFQGSLFNANVDILTKSVELIQRFNIVNLSEERIVYPDSSKPSSINIEFKEMGFENFLPPFHTLP